MPSSTEKARTTNVKVAGNRNGWSLETASRSSPMEERICLRRDPFSSFVRCALYSALYACSPTAARSAFWAARRWSNESRKNLAVRRTAVRSPVGTSTPIVTSASRHLLLSRSYTA